VTIKIDMSAGELFDLIMPAAFVLSALLSIWVLASARKRFSLPIAIAIAVATLFLPVIVFPLYLALMMWRPKIGPPKKWRYALPLLYGALVLSAIAGFYYFDSRSVDAHLARATQAKLIEDSTTAIREYRQALALEDDPHTRKLLAIELANAGDLTEALSEFRLAQKGGEQDDLISYRVGILLERMNQTGQAKLEFQNFLMSSTCMQIDARCEDARNRLNRP
jgi:tetratricopeptide (TPR) repeat protein